MQKGTSFSTNRVFLEDHSEEVSKSKSGLYPFAGICVSAKGFHPSDRLIMNGSSNFGIACDVIHHHGADHTVSLCDRIQKLSPVRPFCIRVPDR